MTGNIHPTAIIGEGVRLGKNVQIGPWCQLEGDISIGDGCKIHASVIIEGITKIGSNVEIYPFSTIGLPPQDLKYTGEPTTCEIGEGTIIREGVSIHRGTTQGGGVTRVGKNAFLLASCHIAHDCQIGDRVIVVNNVVMGGHVHIGNDAKIMGSAALHQHVRIGQGAVVGGLCGVERDVIPYASVLGNRARLVGLNWVGLKRSGVAPEELRELRHAFRTLYPHNEKASSLSIQDRITAVRKQFGHIAQVAEILDFMQADSVRGLTSPYRDTGCDEPTLDIN